MEQLDLRPPHDSKAQPSDNVKLHDTHTKAFHVLPRRLSLKIMRFLETLNHPPRNPKKNTRLETELLKSFYFLSLFLVLVCPPSCRWRGSLFVHVRHAAREA